MKKEHLIKAFRLISLLSFLSFISGCNDDEGQVPYVHVDFYININNPSYNDLRGVGGWVYVSGGSKGIIIYRKSQDEFNAYDRHCTYRPDEPCNAAKVDPSDIKITCDDCQGSEYSILDGTVIEGPAARPLKQYQTSFRDDRLHVYN